MGAQEAASQIQTLWKTNNVSPLRRFYPPLVQAPIFISVFLALRNMAALPVRGGGGCWVDP